MSANLSVAYCYLLSQQIYCGHGQLLHLHFNLTLLRLKNYSFFIIVSVLTWTSKGYQCSSYLYWNSQVYVWSMVNLFSAPSNISASSTSPIPDLMKLPSLETFTLVAHSQSAPSLVTSFQSVLSQTMSGSQISLISSSVKAFWTEIFQKKIAISVHKKAPKKHPS